MTEARIIRINHFYKIFPEIRPQNARKILGTRYVYIHRLDISRPVGVPVKRFSNDVFAPMYPDLETWLMSNYHPQLEVDLHVSSKKITPITEFNLFKIPPEESPALFSGPECSYHEVYRCAAAFTYELLYRDRNNQLRMIDDTIHKRIRNYRDDPSRKLQDDVNVIIDRHIIARYKSLANAAQELKRYIETTL